MSEILDEDKLGVRDQLGERFAVIRSDEDVTLTVNHDTWDRDLLQDFRPIFGVDDDRCLPSDHAHVSRSTESSQRQVSSPIDVAREHLLLVKRDLGHAEPVLREALWRVVLGGACEGELRLERGLGEALQTRAREHEDGGAESARLTHVDDMRQEHSAHGLREQGDIFGELEFVHEGDRVGGEIDEGVGWGDTAGAAGEAANAVSAEVIEMDAQTNVAVLETIDEEAVRGELFAQVAGPERSQHVHSADEDQRRVLGVAEGIVPKRDVGFDFFAVADGDGGHDD